MLIRNASLVLICLAWLSAVAFSIGDGADRGPAEARAAAVEGAPPFCAQEGLERIGPRAADFLRAGMAPAATTFGLALEANSPFCGQRGFSLARISGERQRAGSRGLSSLPLPAGAQR